MKRKWFKRTEVSHCGVWNVALGFGLLHIIVHVLGTWKSVQGGDTCVNDEWQKHLDDDMSLFTASILDRGKKFISSIITDNETWLYHFTLTNKQSSMEWRYLGSLRKRKFKVALSADKVVVTIFGDLSGVLLVDIMPVHTVPHRWDYEKPTKRNVMDISLKLHNNVCAHTAQRPQSFWTLLLKYLPYRQDLGPVTYICFLFWLMFLLKWRTWACCYNVAESAESILLLFP